MTDLVVIETPRLILRVFEEPDLDALESVHGNAQVMRFSIDGPKTRDQIRRFIRNTREGHQRDGHSQWAIVWKATGQCIGDCGILFQDVDRAREHEISYRLSPEFWRRGIATEAAAACRTYGFEMLRLDRLISIIDPQNVASIRVAEKIGLRREKDCVFHGIPVGIYAAERSPQLKIPRSRA